MKQGFFSLLYDTHMINFNLGTTLHVEWFLHFHENKTNGILFFCLKKRRVLGKIVENRAYM